MGYNAGGDEAGRAGENSNERRNGTSGKEIEEMSVLVSLEVPSLVKIERGGGSRLSDGIAENARSRRSSELGKSLLRSADCPRHLITRMHIVDSCTYLAFSPSMATQDGFKKPKNLRMIKGELHWRPVIAVAKIRPRAVR